MPSLQAPPTRKDPRKHSKDAVDTVENLDTKQPIVPTRKATKIRVRKRKHSKRKSSIGYCMGPVISVVFGDFTGLEKIDNSVRTNALSFLIVVSNSFSLGDLIGGLGKNVRQFLGELLVLEVGECVTCGV